MYITVFYHSLLSHAIFFSIRSARSAFCDAGTKQQWIPEIVLLLGLAFTVKVNAGEDVAAEETLWKEL